MKCEGRRNFFFPFGFYGPFKNISLISSRSFIKGGRKPENLGKNHLTICQQNLAFPPVTRARLEPQHKSQLSYPLGYGGPQKGRKKNMSQQMTYFHRIKLSEKQGKRMKKHTYIHTKMTYFQIYRHFLFKPLFSKN